MSFESAFYLLLKNVVGGRVYPGRLPQSPTLPAIDFLNVGGSSMAAQDSVGPRNPRVRLNVWAKDYDSLITTSESAISALHGNNGSFSAIFEGDQDIDDPNTGLFHRVLEFSVIWV